MSYDREYARWRQSPVDFWRDAMPGVTWSTTPTTIYDPDAGCYGRWFPDGMLNSCYNALDRHVATRGKQTALICDSAMTGEVARYSFAELTEWVARAAGMIANCGVKKGDRVIIYMPMIAQAVVAMLACARIGAIHSVVFGGFAARELAIRIDDATPTLLITASCGLEPGRIVAYKPLVDQALAIAQHKIGSCIVVQRSMLRAHMTAGRDLDWDSALASASPHPCVAVQATDHAYILYTSGTTGKPKGIVRDTGGHAVALTWSMRNIYDSGAGDVFWAASDIGWVVGHSYIVYAPLFVGATTLLFEGKPVGTPDAGIFWRMVERHGVNTLFAAPTAIRAIKRDDPEGEHIKAANLASLTALFLAGERADPATIAWAELHLSIPVVDHWWQTETGWPIAANCLGVENLPMKAGSATRAVPGFDVRILDDDGTPLPQDQTGAIAISLPLPPGCAPTLWGGDDDFRAAYLSAYPGYYATGDGGLIDGDDYLWVMGRTDDIINVAGHRLSTGEMEEILSAHPDIAECAVIGVPDALKGEVPLGLVVAKDGIEGREQTIIDELIARVRDQIGPVAGFKNARIVNRLPKTRSGKILRKSLRQLATGTFDKMPPTIEDPAAIDEVAVILSDFSGHG